MPDGAADDPALLERRVQRLLRVHLWGRWLLAIALWCTLGAFCLWRLRGDIALWREYFTWAAVRVSLQHNRLEFMGLGLCVALTLSTLIWQSTHILFGVRGREYRALVRQVRAIGDRGSDHPLWVSVWQER